MNSNNSDTTAIVNFLLFGAFVWLASTWRPFSDEVTVYRAVCPNGLVKGACPKDEMAAERTTYRAERNPESVTVWSDIETPFKFSNCAIQDKENWSCTEKSSLGLYRLMTNGSMVNTSGDFSYEVPMWRWWLIRIKEWGKERPASQTGTS